MTRARALKQLIRDRAAKTGERYTTARRHILKAVPPRAQAAPPVRPAKPASTKGGLSDAKAIEKTGHDLAHWFAVLDRFDAVAKGHTAAARHLYDEHGVDGWYAQGITVAYERARGVRAQNQRCDGAFEVSVSKVMTATSAQVIKAITDNRMRKRWIGEADAKLAGALTAAVTDKSSKGFVVRPDGQARFRYKWDGTTVQLYLLPKPGNKTSLVVQHTKLAGAAAVETHRAEWKTAFGALAKTLTT
jgi:hypothetical protein